MPGNSHAKIDRHIEGRAASARLFDLLFPDARRRIEALRVVGRQFYRDARPAGYAVNQHSGDPRRTGDSVGIVDTWQVSTGGESAEIRAE